MSSKKLVPLVVTAVDRAAPLALHLEPIEDDPDQRLEILTSLLRGVQRSSGSTPTRRWTCGDTPHLVDALGREVPPGPSACACEVHIHSLSFKHLLRLLQCLGFEPRVRRYVGRLSCGDDLHRAIVVPGGPICFPDHSPTERRAASALYALGECPEGCLEWFLNTIAGCRRYIDPFDCDAPQIRVLPQDRELWDACRQFSDLGLGVHACRRVISDDQCTRIQRVQKQTRDAFIDAVEELRSRGEFRALPGSTYKGILYEVDVSIVPRGQSASVEYYDPYDYHLFYDSNITITAELPLRWITWARKGLHLYRDSTRAGIIIDYLSTSTAYVFVTSEASPHMEALPLHHPVPDSVLRTDRCWDRGYERRRK